MLSLVDEVCPGFIRKVADVLAFAPTTRSGSVPAILESIHQTSKNVDEIQYLRPRGNVGCVCGCSG